MPGVVVDAGGQWLFIGRSALIEVGGLELEAHDVGAGADVVKHGIADGVGCSDRFVASVAVVVVVEKDPLAGRRALAGVPQAIAIGILIGVDGNSADGDVAAGDEGS